MEEDSSGLDNRPTKPLFFCNLSCVRFEVIWARLDLS